MYSRTKASQITGCSRRQFQYCREKSVVVPTVNPSGKGWNVYYSDSDLVALTVMEYVLLCRFGANTLRERIH
ncbi:MAG TPA: MerR family transcriptional regulator [Candidatus Sericytochromatia bacterium]